MEFNAFQCDPLLGRRSKMKLQNDVAQNKPKRALYANIESLNIHTRK